MEPFDQLQHKTFRPARMKTEDDLKDAKHCRTAASTAASLRHGQDLIGGGWVGEPVREGAHDLPDTEIGRQGERHHVVTGSIESELNPATAGLFTDTVHLHVPLGSRNHEVAAVERGEHLVLRWGPTLAAGAVANRWDVSGSLGPGHADDDCKSLAGRKIV